MTRASHYIALGPARFSAVRVFVGDPARPGPALARLAESGEDGCWLAWRAGRRGSCASGGPHFGGLGASRGCRSLTRRKGDSPTGGHRSVEVAHEKVAELLGVAERDAMTA